MLSEVKRDNDSFRFDSEYFKREYLSFYKNLKSKKYMILGDDGDIKGGKRLPLGEEFVTKGIPYIRAEDNKKGFVDFESSPKITEALHKKLKSYQTNFNDILVTNVGNSIGDVGIVKFKIDKCNLTENCIKIINLKQNNTNYIFSFLNSKYGNLQILREMVGTAQPKLAIERVRNFIIPILSQTFQSKIENLVTSSHTKLEQSKTLYKQAEDLLLEELDLKNFKPSTENIAIKSFSESFGITGRLDSEYYQPKYDEVLEKIKKSNFDKLGNLVNIKKSIETGSEAYADNGVKYMRVSNLTKFGISESSISIPFEYFNLEKKDKNGETELDRLLPKKDTVLLSKDGTVGISYVVKNETNFITSGAILHLNIKDEKSLLPEYLSLVLNSLVVKMQSDRDAGGSIIKHWKPSEISNVLIPKIDFEIQTKIENLIKTSFQLKEKSKQLLEIAKKSVEIAIEKDENSAMEFIK